MGTYYEFLSNSTWVFKVRDKVEEQKGEECGIPSEINNERHSFGVSGRDVPKLENEFLLNNKGSHHHFILFDVFLLELEITKQTHMAILLTSDTIAQFSLIPSSPRSG